MIIVPRCSEPNNHAPGPRAYHLWAGITAPAGSGRLFVLDGLGTFARSRGAASLHVDPAGLHGFGQLPDQLNREQAIVKACPRDLHEVRKVEGLLEAATCNAAV